MSKQKALDELSERAIGLMVRDVYGVGIRRQSLVDTDEELVTAWQSHHGLKPDGWPGSKTLAALWMLHTPTAEDVVAAARAALAWPAVAYSMKRNTGLGESWLPDLGTGYETGDCSDFACHCLGIPKDQTDGLATADRSRVWLGADAIALERIGKAHPLTEARPGDLIVYGGKWERGERVAVGHVEVCVEIDERRIITIGCASSNHLRNANRSAIDARDKTDLWRRKKAVAVRPWWYA